MYGYVRPAKDELLVKEYDAFRAAYCGLCHSLKKKYGAAARFALSYDLTYLAMLYWEPGDLCTERKRCPASPLRKKKCSCECPALEKAAAVAVILAKGKLADTMADEGFFRKVRAWPAYMAAKRWAKKTAMPEYDELVKKRLAELDELEKQGCKSIDMAADKFALCLAAAGKLHEDETRGRILSQVLYHTGRIIYILDAYADLEEDRAKNRYNAVAARYMEDGVLDDSEKEAIKETLADSMALMEADFELLPETVYTPVVRNIIKLGLPRTAQLVLEGKFKPDNRHEPD